MDYDPAKRWQLIKDRAVRGMVDSVNAEVEGWPDGMAKSGPSLAALYSVLSRFIDEFIEQHSIRPLPANELRFAEDVVRALAKQGRKYLYAHVATLNPPKEVRTTWLANHCRLLEDRAGDLATVQESIGNQSHLNAMNDPQRGRRKGSGGYAKSDAPLVEKMRKLVLEKDLSPWQAAGRVTPEAAGGGQPEAKQKRLFGVYVRTYRD